MPVPTVTADAEAAPAGSRCCLCGASGAAVVFAIRPHKIIIIVCENCYLDAIRYGDPIAAATS